MTATISWDTAKLAKLKAAISEAKSTGKTVFEIELKPEGKVELLVRYAEYLVEYLDGQFAANPNQPARPYNEGEEPPRSSEFSI